MAPNAISIIADDKTVSPQMYQLWNWYAKDSEGKNLVFFHENPSPKKNRDIDSINSIIFHETAGWGGKPSTPPDSRWKNGEVGTHFRVLPSGRIVQHYDLNRILMHAGSNYNTFSIGIEFSNPVWTDEKVGWITPPSTSDNPERREVIATWYKNYIVPPKIQLESLHLLLNQLKPLIGSNLNFDHEDYWRAYNYDGAEKNFKLNGWTTALKTAYKNKPGFYAHINIGSHSDGWFQNLYLFLRFVRRLSADDAYDLAKNLIKLKKSLIKIP